MNPTRIGIMIWIDEKLEGNNEMPGDSVEYRVLRTHSDVVGMRYDEEHNEIAI